MIFLLILAAMPALYGGFLIVDFLLWYFTSERIEGEVTGFQKKQNKGQNLPIIRVPDKDGATRAIRVSRIDEISYVLRPAVKGEIKTLLVRKEAPDQAVVFGFFGPLAGGVLLLPFLAVLGVVRGDALLTGQMMYLLVFAAVVGAALIAMKFIQNHY